MLTFRSRIYFPSRNQLSFKYRKRIYNNSIFPYFMISKRMWQSLDKLIPPQTESPTMIIIIGTTTRDGQIRNWDHQVSVSQIKCQTKISLVVCEKPKIMFGRSLSQSRKCWSWSQSCWFRPRESRGLASP